VPALGVSVTGPSSKCTPFRFRNQVGSSVSISFCVI
jgi:hypothetical protein